MMDPKYCLRLAEFYQKLARAVPKRARLHRETSSLYTQEALDGVAKHAKTKRRR